MGPVVVGKELCKVVITDRSGKVVKGYSSAKTPENLDLSDAQYRLDELLESCVKGDGTKLEVDPSNVKAIFFVSTFEGNREQQPVRFYSNGAEPKLIWVEIQFKDGEVIEGCIQNTIHHLQSDGFFMLPSSPGGNNLLIYVNKDSITKYRVLGVRI